MRGSSWARHTCLPLQQAFLDFTREHCSLFHNNTTGCKIPHCSLLSCPQLYQYPYENDTGL